MAIKLLKAQKKAARAARTDITVLGSMPEPHVDPVNMAIKLLKAQKKAARAA